MPLDARFERAISRLRSSFFSLERATRKMVECLEVLHDEDLQLRDGMSLEAAVPWLEAHEDVHLFADLVTDYLYDYADGLAVVLRRFFARDGVTPSEKTFMKHLTSVSEGAAVDPLYASLLQENTSWWRALADPLKAPTPGIRTLLVHGHGRPSDFRQPFFERARAPEEVLGGFFSMHEALLPWLVDRVAPHAVEGTRAALVIEEDPPFMVFGEPVVGLGLFSNPLFPDAGTGPDDVVS